MTRTATKRIAVVGASADRSKFGNKCVRAYRDRGWEVCPVNPAAAEIEGLPVSARLADIPGPLHRISVYLPPATTHLLLSEILSRGAEEIWFNPGAATAATVAAAIEAGAQVFDACSIVDIGASPSEYPDS